MSQTLPRKGFSRTADIPSDILQALSQGTIPSATLTEGLALNQAQLLQAVFPALSKSTLAAANAACQLGILKRMQTISALLLKETGTEGINRCQTHGSDTVRGWACFMIGAQTGLALQTRLALIQPLADDEHFGVREWAWMAVRPHLVSNLTITVTCLSEWTRSPSERVRRFASESIRPRGVWCSHIAEFKQHPEQALPILSPLRADPSVYVQDSVANWLNDAAKDQPVWVSQLCEQWLLDSPTDATRRICQRALRNVK
ncbi:DNA alkylation repair protein [uncultured Cedecea sp.]|uniref:DNA alkylation repair protein n=1 Tax=uncultured Cedecea sp. TaxID=988762 RepID=UPI002601E08D|nr:DNA alkylation repair protein [uncultured Cedecea sp.]